MVLGWTSKTRMYFRRIWAERNPADSLPLELVQSRFTTVAAGALKTPRESGNTVVVNAAVVVVEFIYPDLSLSWLSTRPKYESVPSLVGCGLESNSPKQYTVLVKRFWAEINAQGGLYGNALQAASLRGHDKIVQLLQEKGAEINAQGGRFGNALQAASLRGHEKIVQLLLEQGAEINAQGGEYGNALQAASEGGNDKIVQLLLDKGAEINAQGGGYGNAL